MYYVYVLSCKGDVYYSGITTDVKRRFRQHSGEIKGGAKFTKSHPPESIAAVWSAPDRASASRLEYKLHRMNRCDKEKLFNTVATLRSGEIIEQFPPIAIE